MKWKVIWAAFLLILLSGEFSPWGWAAGLGWFALWEGLALKRAERGDTFSEQMVGLLYDFGRDTAGAVVRREDGRPATRRMLPARVPLILGVTAYLCLALVSLLGATHGYAADLFVWRMGALAGGVFVWLIFHFMFALEKG